MQALGLILLSLLCAMPTSRAQSSLKLERHPDPTLKLNVTVPPIVGASVKLTLEKSADLKNWHSSYTLATDESGEHHAPFSLLHPAEFYRLSIENLLLPTPDPGADMIGLTPAYRRNLQSIGDLPLAEFIARYPQPSDYLPGIDWDPTTACFWNEFNLDPAVHNAGLAPNEPARRSTDFRLNSAELELFKKNGFVVSARQRSSLGGLLYQIYSHDLPLFLSTDAILLAWHRTHLHMLMELEQSWFVPEWSAILAAMADRIPALHQQLRGTALEPALLDCEYFITVARRLLTFQVVPSMLGQDAAVAQTLNDILLAEKTDGTSIFGRCRRIDFTQFKPRGYYVETAPLQRYFRLMMWLGRIDFRITPEAADATCNQADPQRDLRSAAILLELLKQAGAADRWSKMNAVIESFVGLSDSLNFPQLEKLLALAHITSLSELAQDDAITKLQDTLAVSNFGIQQIMSDIYVTPRGKIPRSFAVFGQRFVPDSWALGHFIFDNILWGGQPVPRFMPSVVDVGFSVLGNNALVPFIADGITSSGLPYQHNLAAIRMTLDQQEPSFWQQNIYLSWLDALRSLSEPSTHPRFPQVMRTRAWAHRTANTQFASWTHLRYNTLLYARQSYGPMGCSFPETFVEPVVPFWKKLQAMALKAAVTLENLDVPDRKISGFGFTTTSATIRSNQVTSLQNFASRMSTLADISTAELEDRPLTPDQTEFLQNVVEIQAQYEGLKFSGWLPELFYRSAYHIPTSIAGFHSTNGICAGRIITDVHTDPDNGLVLQQAVGDAQLMYLAVDRGTNRAVFAGPILSHYEFTKPQTQRMTDSDWRGVNPPPPSGPWTTNWLVRPP